MICVLCGDQVEDGEIFIELKQYRKLTLSSGAELRIPVHFDNGALFRCAHSLCPPEYGAPLTLVGMDGAKVDV